MEEKQRSEERKFKRRDVSFTVSYKVNSPPSVRMSVGGREFEAEALDLSQAGMAVLTKYTDVYAVPCLTMVTLRFTVPDDAAANIRQRYNSVEIKGEVRSSVFLHEQKAYRLGISFIDLSEEQRKFIADFINISP